MHLIFIYLFSYTILFTINIDSIHFTSTYLYLITYEPISFNSISWFEIDIQLGTAIHFLVFGVTQKKLP